MTDTRTTTGESAPPAPPSPPSPPDGPGSAPATPSAPDDVQHHLAALRAVHEELTRVAAALHHGADTAHHTLHTTRHGLDSARHAVGHAVHHTGVDIKAHCPAWLRPTAGENRWPVAGAILVAIALQMALPDRLSLLNRWLLPALELALLIALVIAVPHRFHKRSRPLRIASLTLTGLLSVANAWSAALLVVGLVAGTEGEDAGPLLSAGAAIWLTNVIAFALWYWQFDRGGPAARAPRRSRRCPTSSSRRCGAPSWPSRSGNPSSWTTCTCRSPTPPRSARPTCMPLSRWAKLTMLAQSLVSLVTVALVIARAVNILK